MMIITITMLSTTIIIIVSIIIVNSCVCIGMIMIIVNGIHVPPPPPPRRASRASGPEHGLARGAAAGGAELQVEGPGLAAAPRHAGGDLAGLSPSPAPFGAGLTGT